MGMTGMELATAARYGARPIILVLNNGRYGTIEMHQDRRYPGRRIGNELSNPDFGAFARSFGLFGARVDDNDGFAGALTDALAADTASVIDLVLSGA
jgi:acetolactate synthase I/II/III large subunit